MIRRHFTPAVAFFCTFLATLFLHARPAGPAGLAAFAPAAAAAAGAVAAAAVSLVLIGSARPDARRAGALALAAGLGLAAGAASLARMTLWQLSARLPAHPAQVSEFSGTARQDSALSRAGDTIVRVRLDSARSAASGVTGPARADVLLVCRGSSTFAMGERLLVRSALRPLAGDGPESYLAVAAGGKVRSLGFASRAWQLRARAREAAGRALSRVGYPASALLEALVTGSREEVPGQLSEGFRRTGTLHVLALSGLHVGVVYGLAFGLLGFVRRRGPRIAVACLVVIAYQLFAGFMPSLQRATLMILAAAVARLLDRDNEPLNLLALSGIAVLAIDPFQAFSLSFQLSYLALAGILLAGPLVERPLTGRVPRVLLAPLAASVGAQLATLPVVLPAFGAWYPSGILASILLVPLTTILLAAGLLWLAVSPLVQGPALGAAAAVFDALYRAVDWTASFFARLPGLEAGKGAAWVTPAAAWAAAAFGLAVVLFPRRLPWHAR